MCGFAAAAALAWLLWPRALTIRPDFAPAQQLLQTLGK
jgi:hypothetical protein